MSVQESGETRELLSSLSDKKKDSNNFLLYCSHFLSAWGDRMWSFAVGLFLVEISPGSLQLTAVYGLVMGGSVLLGAPLVGDWIDSARRLTAARLTIVLQNSLTAVCAGIVYAHMTFTPEQLGLGDWSRYVSYAAIIALSSAALLASVGNTIAVERDWVVEICSSDQARLAVTTATLRAIDLSTQILAPIATGFVMTYAGTANGALFIGGWNVLSMIFEYYLIWWVYQRVPQLARSKIKKAAAAERPERDENSNAGNAYIETSDSHTGSQERLIRDNETEERRESGCSVCCGLFFSGLLTIVRGWRTYAGYRVMLSGLSLSLLYMTVLGFDNVTIGYAQLEGLTEFYVGVAQGVGGLIGIIGATCYPSIQRCIGLPRAALLALFLETTCLSACVVSVWLPGSPFDLFDVFNTNNNSTINSMTSNMTTAVMPTPEGTGSLISVFVLMAGIVTARFGLWVADLSITQMFLESVIDTERGIVNGVQSAINQLMDIIKYGLVVALPFPHQFGLLVIISFLAVASALFLYMIFLCRLPRGAFVKGSREDVGLGEPSARNGISSETVGDKLNKRTKGEEQI